MVSWMYVIVEGYLDVDVRVFTFFKISSGFPWQRALIAFVRAYQITVFETKFGALGPFIDKG